MWTLLDVRDSWKPPTQYKINECDGLFRLFFIFYYYMRKIPFPLGNPFSKNRTGDLLEDFAGPITQIKSLRGDLIRGLNKKVDDFNKMTKMEEDRAKNEEKNFFQKCCDKK